MGAALGHLQPGVRAALGARPSEVARRALAPNFPQLGLPMYPQEGSSQLQQGKSHEVVNQTRGVQQAAMTALKSW